MPAVGRRIVARPTDPGVQPQPVGFANDIGLAHILQRCLDADRVTFNPRLGRKRRHRLKSVDKFGATIGITRIIQRVDADEDVAGPSDFGQSQREGQEDGVARRDIGDGDVGAHATLGHRDISGQRRPAECGQVERQYDVAHRVQGFRDTRSRLQLHAMPLVIVDRQSEQTIARLARQCARDHRIQSARKQDDGEFSLIGNHGPALLPRSRQRKHGAALSDRHRCDVPLR